MRLTRGGVFREPREIAGVAPQLRCDTVVGVASHGEGEDHDAGSGGADELHDAAPRRLVVREVGIAQLRVQAQVHAERLRRALRFSAARRGVALGAGFSLRQVENPDALAGPRRLGEGAAAGELDVVAMGGDGEQIDRIRHSCLRASTGSSRAARAAGAIPNTMPTPIDTAVATPALHTGTCVVKSSSPFRASPAPRPSAIPITPPTSVSVAASTMNCDRIAR